MNLRVRNSAVVVVTVLMKSTFGFVATPRGRCRHSPHAPRSALRRDPRPTAFVTTDATGGHAAASPPHRGRCWGSRAEVCAQCVRSGEWMLVACGQRFGGSALRKDPPPATPLRRTRTFPPPPWAPPFRNVLDSGSVSGQPFRTAALPSSQCVWGSSGSLRGFAARLFVALDDRPSSVSDTVYLFPRLLGGVLVASMFWQ